jgi:hypothetical protein
MADCHEPAVVTRGPAAACALHQFELTSADAREDFPAGLDVAGPGAVCGQHLRQPVTVSGLMSRIDVVCDRLWETAPRQGVSDNRAGFRDAAAELVTLGQALLGLADADTPVSSVRDFFDGAAFGRFQADTSAPAAASPTAPRRGLLARLARMTRHRSDLPQN